MNQLSSADRSRYAAAVSRRTVLKGAGAFALGTLVFSGAGRMYPANAVLPTDAGVPPTLKLTNGKWFNGTTFVDATMFTEKGIFRDKEPATIDQTIDLAGNFVIAPLADAHCHWLAGKGTKEFFTPIIEASLRAGQFYLLDLGGIPSFSPVLDPLINQPTSPDFVTSQQRWTGIGGHPEDAYTKVAEGGILGLSPDKFEGGAYFQVDSEADIDRAWPKFLESKPGIVKIDFLWSEEFDKRANDPAYFSKRGINPELAAILVQKAHKAGLRTIAHIQTGPDFHNALGAGIDAIAHIPVGEFDFVPNPEGGLPSRKFNTSQNYRYVISEEDARYAGEHQIPIATTLSRIDNLRATDPDAVNLVEQEIVLPNLRMLRKYNVPVLIGSDEAIPVIAETTYLARLGIYSPLEVLKMVSEATPQFIFPERKIGLLREGYEASFLVYSGDPLAYLTGAVAGYAEDVPNPAATGTLTLRYKQGHAITVADAPEGTPTH